MSNTIGTSSSTPQQRFEAKLSNLRASDNGAQDLDPRDGFLQTGDPAGEYYSACFDDKRILTEDQQALQSRYSAMRVEGEGVAESESFGDQVFSKAADGKRSSLKGGEAREFHIQASLEFDQAWHIAR